MKLLKLKKRIRFLEKKLVFLSIRHLDFEHDMKELATRIENLKKEQIARGVDSQFSVHDVN